MWDSAWSALGRWITQKDWTPNLNAPSCEDEFSQGRSQRQAGGGGGGEYSPKFLTGSNFLYIKILKNIFYNILNLLIIAIQNKKVDIIINESRRSV